MKKTLYLILLLCGCIAFCSCSKQELETICTNQEVAIDNFITSRYADRTVVSNGGAKRIIMENGFGETAASGSSVNITYSGYIFSSGIGAQFAEETTANVSLDGKEIVRGLESGIIGMKEGESAYIVFSARYGYYNKSVGIIPSMSALIYYVTLQKINSK